MAQYSRRGGIVSIIVILLAVAGVGGLALVLFAQNGQGSNRLASNELFEVRRGDFTITVPASGELAAMRQIEVVNKLETSAVITEIIEEGEFVNEGDVLFKLNDETLREEIRDAEDAVTSAENGLAAAEANLEIAESSAQSQLSAADLAIELAVLALEAWEKGELESQRTALELAVITAEENYTRLKDRYERSQDLFEKKFISFDELKQDEISMIEAEARRRQAKLDKEVYDNYTYKQERKTKESDVRQAKDERLRIEKRLNAELTSARSDVESAKRQLENRRERLEKLRRQIKYCVVTAPSDGLVVYKSSLERDRRGDDPPEIGTSLHRNETVIVLPDTSSMIAEVKVNEALAGSIEPGQRATVITDALPGVTLDGEVLGIGVLAESGNWRDPNRRDYTVRIKLLEENKWGLKPSMRCKANIYIDEVNDALHVPVQSVFRDGRDAYVWTPLGNKFARQNVQIGKSSELFVEIRDGLEPGRLVLLREPQRGEIAEGHEPEEDENGEQPSPGDQQQPSEDPEDQFDDSLQNPQEGGQQRPGDLSADSRGSEEQQTADRTDADADTDAADGDSDSAEPTAQVEHAAADSDDEQAAEQPATANE